MKFLDIVRSELKVNYCNPRDDLIFICKADDGCGCFVYKIGEDRTWWFSIEDIKQTGRGYLEENKVITNKKEITMNEFLGTLRRAGVKLSMEPMPYE